MCLEIAGRLFSSASGMTATQPAFMLPKGHRVLEGEDSTGNHTLEKFAPFHAGLRID
jgi:hypothetical protein